MPPACGSSSLFPVPAKKSPQLRRGLRRHRAPADAPARGLRRRDLGRHLPVQLHRVRPLLRARLARTAGSLRHVVVARVVRRELRQGRRRRHLAVGHERWPRRASARGARCRRLRHRADHELQHQVREQLLRPVPRCRGLRAAVRRPPQLPARRAQSQRCARVQPALRGRGRGPAHGEARSAVGGSHPPDPRADRLARRRVPGERRIHVACAAGARELPRLRHWPARELVQPAPRRRQLHHHVRRAARAQSGAPR